MMTPALPLPFSQPPYLGIPVVSMENEWDMTQGLVYLQLVNLNSLMPLPLCTVQ